MSTFKYKLKGARWLRMYTAAEKSSVYAVQSEAQKIADTLCDVPWTRAKSDGPAMFPLTDAKTLDENPANRDLFDAALFCAEHSDGAHRAYANAAMYLFKLPSTSGVGLNSVTVHVESDAYNALGARIAVHLLSSAELPTVCATVRTGAAHAEGVAPRRTEERNGRNYWYSNSADVTITGGTTESPAVIGNLTQYLAVFVGMENYAVSRNEWLEGASYIRNLVEIETDAQVSDWMDDSTHECADEGEVVLLAGGSSPTWLQPLPTVNAGATAGTVADDGVVDTFFTSAVTSTTSRPKASTWVIQGSAEAVSFTASINLYGTDASAANGTITCSGYNINGEPATETVTLAKGTFSNKTYLYYIASGNLTYRLSETVYTNSAKTATGQQTSYKKLHVYIEVPTFTVTDASQGMYVVNSASAKWFIYGSASDNQGPVPSTSSNTMGYLYTVAGGTFNTNLSTALQLFDIETDTFYWMLKMNGIVPLEMDACGVRNDESSRRGLGSVTSGTESPWNITVEGGAAFTVDVSGQSVTLAESPSGQSWVFTLSESTTGQSYFDASANLRVGNTSIENYGLAATLGDFSHAVATFEKGTQPSNAELLGRLARMSRGATGDMLYLHPENSALAAELDMLRPVPRFWRTSEDPTGQTSCQPGLSVWYNRPATTSNNVTTVDPSAAASGIVQRDNPTRETVVSNPVFLQLTVLALRSPSAFSARLVMENNTASAVTNHFKMRFVAWKCPAGQWDGSNAFAMAAMASMPSVYRSDGEDNVAWSVNCGDGSLLRFGTRNMTAERIGVSPVVSGNIAANSSVAIPLAAPVTEGDVVLIAPEVLGFADGAGGTSKYFGRSSDPATHTDAGKGWARFANNLGWFPKVTGE